MKRISLFLTMCSILLLSCENKFEDGGIYISNNTEQTSSPYHITLEQALNNMYSTMDALNLGTRAKCRVVKDVQLIPSARRQTRSGDALGAFYVVNFENDEGFAILAADTRISADVIGIGEQGNFEYVPIEESMTRSGVIDTLDTSADVLTLDDLYVPEEDDYLLGGGKDDGNNFLSRAIDILDGNIENPIDNGDGGGTGGGGNYRIIETTEELISPLISTKWGQNEPYNYKCPRYYYYLHTQSDTIRYKVDYDFPYDTFYGYVGYKLIATGCIATALAQILAYHNYPNTNTILGESDVTDWGDFPIELGTDSIPTHIDHISSLMYTIGVGCNMYYGFGGGTQSFSTPQRARNYMEQLGYQNVKRHTYYTTSTIRQMLRNDCPVLIGALSSLEQHHDYWGGHAWVIDGYHKEIENWYFADNNQLYKTVTNHYVHCNWGWDGDLNGWFTSNLFDTTKEEEYDSDENSTFSRNYSWWRRVITYDKPNN